MNYANNDIKILKLKNEIKNHQPSDKLMLGLFNGCLFGFFLAIAKFHKSLPEYNFSIFKKIGYTTRCSLFFGTIYGTHLYFEQYFDINKPHIKKEFNLSNKSLLILSNLISAFAPVILAMPVYYYKNSHIEFQPRFFMYMGIVFFVHSYYLSNKENNNLIIR